MMNRLRTALLSVAAVAVSMMVLGSNAQAKSVATRPQSYLKFLRQLPSAANGRSLLQRYNSPARTLNIPRRNPAPGPRQIQRIATLYNREMSVFSRIQNNINALLANGISLLQRYNSLARTLNILRHNLAPGPRQIQRIATLYNREMSVFSRIQNNINALLASEAVLQGKYLALQAQKEALLSAGRVFRARQVALQQGQVLNVENSVQRLIVTERGVATPTR